MCSIDKSMITFNEENVTKKEYREILFAKQKVEYYKQGSMPRFVNDLPNVIDYRSHMYVNRKDILHKGQYKLYLSEIDFLTDYAKYGSLVIYVGAAAGHHINKLYDDFGHLNLKYHLYDTNYFDSLLQTKDNITLFHEYFTDEHCQKYKKIKDILFISDIRNMEVLKSTTDVVPMDMSMQMNWVLNIKPRACMLKFRLPYNSNNLVEYLDGEIRLQAYAPNSTTECRLVATKPYTLKLYNPIDNENRLFYLNKMVRHWYEFDKILEAYILKKYARFIKNEI